MTPRSIRLKKTKSGGRLAERASLPGASFEPVFVFHRPARKFPGTNGQAGVPDAARPAPCSNRPVPPVRVPWQELCLPP